MTKKLNVDFVLSSTPIDDVMSNALLTQLMITITQIGIRVDKHKSTDDIIDKGKENVEQKQ